MGRRSRRRGAEQLAAPETPYEDAEGNVLVLRGAMTPATRSQYATGARPAGSIRRTRGSARSSSCSSGSP